MIHLEVYVADTAELLATPAYGAGAPLHWESSATQGGTYVEGGTVPLVSGVSLYDIWDPNGVVGMWYRTRVSNVGETTFSEYSGTFQGGLAHNLVTAADVRALIPNALTDDQLQAVIDREEAYVANELNWPVGLGEPFTQTFYMGDPAMFGLYWDTAMIDLHRGGMTFWWVQNQPYEPLHLLRPADSAVVVDDGVTVADSDIRFLRRGTMIERASGGWRGPIVTATYTPKDILQVVRVVIELARLTLTETGYQSERIGDYSYAKHVRSATGTVEETRKVLVRSIQSHWPVGTMRVAGSNESVRIGGIT
jgi:hypothetical protein